MVGSRQVAALTRDEAPEESGSQLMVAALCPLGVTPAQAEVLQVLADRQPLTLTGLGGLLVCESGTNPSRLIDRLATAGLAGGQNRARTGGKSNSASPRQPRQSPPGL